MQNKVNINDWSSVQSLFDKLNKQLEKTQKVTDAIGVPRVYVRILVELEDGLKKTLADKDAKKKMSPTNAKALNTMRQRLKKHNVSFQEQIDKFRENPESTEEEPSDASDDDSGSDDGSDEDEEQEDLDVDGFEKVLLQSLKIVTERKTCLLHQPVCILPIQSLLASTSTIHSKPVSLYCLQHWLRIRSLCLDCKHDMSIFLLGFWLC